MTERLRDLLDAEVVTTWLPDSVGRLCLVAVAGEWPDELRDMTAPPTAKIVRVWERGASARVNSALDDPELDQHLARRLSLRNGLWAPMAVGEQRVGMIAAYNKTDPALTFSDVDLRTAEAVGRRAALAVLLQERGDARADDIASWADRSASRYASGRRSAG